MKTKLKPAYLLAPQDHVIYLNTTRIVKAVTTTYTKRTGRIYVVHFTDQPPACFTPKEKLTVIQKPKGENQCKS